MSTGQHVEEERFQEYCEIVLQYRSMLLAKGLVFEQESLEELLFTSGQWNMEELDAWEQKLAPKYWKNSR